MDDMQRKRQIKVFGETEPQDIDKKGRNGT